MKTIALIVALIAGASASAQAQTCTTPPAVQHYKIVNVAAYQANFDFYGFDNVNWDTNAFLNVTDAFEATVLEYWFARGWEFVGTTQNVNTFLFRANGR